MANPKVVYQNLLAFARAGRGDGTAYASGSSMTPDADNKTFDLTGIVFISDLADTDDALNGLELVHTPNGNTYLITDWATGTKLATVKDTPISTDTGAFEIRRTLQTDDFDADYPLRAAANGRLYKKWVDGAANNQVDIEIALPNAMEDGGFESGTITGWNSSTDDDGTIAVNGTGPILGSYDMRLNKNTGIWVRGYKPFSEVAFKAGVTYMIRLKAKAGAATTTNMRFAIYPTAIAVPDEFDILSTLDLKSLTGDIESGGAAIKSIFMDLDTTPQWKVATFSPPVDYAAGDLGLWIECAGFAPMQPLTIDEIYVCEAVYPDTLVLGGHNLVADVPAGSEVRALACTASRSSYAAGNDSSQLFDINANVANAGREVIYEEFTAPALPWPILAITLAAKAGYTWEAAEIWIGELWDWARPPNRILTAMEDQVESNQSYSKGHVGIGELLADYRFYDDIVNLIEPAEALIWKDFQKKNGHGAPFWLIIPADSGLDQAEEVIFMRCPQAPVIEPELPGYYMAFFIFEGAF